MLVRSSSFLSSQQSHFLRLYTSTTQAMFSPVVPPPTHSQRSQEFWRHFIVPLTLWICVVAVVRYGFYENFRMVLRPSSSRLIQESSVFVQQVEVTNEDRKGIFFMVAEN